MNHMIRMVLVQMPLALTNYWIQVSAVFFYSNIIIYLNISTKEILSRLNVKYALNCLDASSLKIINSVSKNLTIKMFHVKNCAAHFVPKPVHELVNFSVYSHTQT